MFHLDSYNAAVGTPMMTGGRTPALDHSTIQRAVSSLPPQMYNTLAAVAGATPLVGGYSVPVSIVA